MPTVPGVNHNRSHLPLPRHGAAGAQAVGKDPERALREQKLAVVVHHGLNAHQVREVQDRHAFPGSEANGLQPAPEETRAPKVIPLQGCPGLREQFPYVTRPVRARGFGSDRYEGRRQHEQEY